MIFGAAGCDGATAGGVLPVRSSGGQVLGGCLGGEFGAGGDAELGEDVGHVHLDGAGGDEQAPGDGVAPQAFADETDDLSFGWGQAGPAATQPRTPGEVVLSWFLVMMEACGERSRR